ncbi:MAG: 4'-phosphopantetheinyl transferase superfamily protein [Cardiobacteriaceae bacterium]|nr:4'-phosphopantetheinyl transferase superfamily protein [Cardiobacteriaceae bacterium]
MNNLFPTFDRLLVSSHKVKNSLKSNFVKCYSIGYVKNYPAVRYCLLQFCINNYNKDLFSYFNISPPDKIIKLSIVRQAEYLASRYAISLIRNNNISLGKNFNLSSKYNVCISHSKSFVIVISSNSFHSNRFGIDLEINRLKNFFIIKDCISSALEQNILSSLNIPVFTALAILFSVKESSYKLLSDALPFDFSFADFRLVSFDEKNQKLILETRNISHSSNKIYTVGYYDFSQEKLLTLSTSRVQIDDDKLVSPHDLVLATSFAEPT